MPEFSAQMIPQNQCATVVRTRGVTQAWENDGRGPTEGSGVEEISTAGKFAEYEWKPTPRRSSLIRVRSGDEGTFRPRTCRRALTGETDYLAGNHSRICPGGSGH